MLFKRTSTFLSIPVCSLPSNISAVGSPGYSENTVPASGQMPWALYSLQSTQLSEDSFFTLRSENWSISSDFFQTFLHWLEIIGDSLQPLLSFLILGNLQQVPPSSWPHIVLAKPDFWGWSHTSCRPLVYRQFAARFGYLGLDSTNLKVCWEKYLTTIDVYPVVAPWSSSKKMCPLQW